MSDIRPALNYTAEYASKVPSDIINYIGGTYPATKVKASLSELAGLVSRRKPVVASNQARPSQNGSFVVEASDNSVHDAEYWAGNRTPKATYPPQVNDRISGSGIPSNGQIPVGPTIYQNASGEQIAPQAGRSIMDRPGAFTGPNNDPTTPGMTREYTSEPELTAFNPDDARFEKRNIEIEQQKERMKRDLQAREIASREKIAAEEMARRLTHDKYEQEDRVRRQKIEDQEQAYRADAMARAERRAAEESAWSAQHGGQPYSPQAVIKQMQDDREDATIATHDINQAIISANKLAAIRDLEIVEKGGVPSDLDSIKMIAEITGKDISKVRLSPADIAAAKEAIEKDAERSREMVTKAYQSRMHQIKITKSEKDSEFE